MHEVYGNSIEIPDELDVNLNATGYIRLTVDDKVLIFWMNLHGDITKVAFRYEYLPIFFETNGSIELDVFKLIPNSILFDKLLNHYILDFCEYDSELDKIIRNYTRERKLNLLLD